MPYTIKDMSELTGLPPSTLRYYDKQGLLPHLQRDPNNSRIFSEDDYHNLKLIDCLKRSGLSIKDIKKFIDIAGKGGQALHDKRDIFTRRREILRQELANLQEILNVIEYKCWFYDRACEVGSEDAVKNLPLSEIPEEFREAREHLKGTMK